MNYIGAIEGMNISPISEYNNLLKGSASFDVDSDLDFENVLNKQTQAISQKPQHVKGGFEINMNLDDLSPQTNAVDKLSAQNFMNSIGKSFGGGISAVDQKAHAAEKAQEALAMGEDISVHDVMIAAEKASLSMQMALQLRNKLVTAYTEINNVRV